jgi:hypothetical protein
MTDKPTVNGIGEAEYQAWRNHPATLMFRRYLRDFRQSLGMAAMQRWEAGALLLSSEHEIRAKREVLAEMADVPFESIAEFYSQPEEGDAAEIAQDRNSGIRPAGVDGKERKWGEPDW